MNSRTAAEQSEALSSTNKQTEEREREQEREEQQVKSLIGTLGAHITLSNAFEMSDRCFQPGLIVKWIVIATSGCWSESTNSNAVTMLTSL